MADIPQEVREAAARALGYKSWADATDYRLTGEQDRQRDRMAQALHAMFLAGKRAGMRLEQVSGTTLDEMRANLSSHLRNSGDCVLCWVNEGDLAEQVIAQAIRSENDG